MKPELELATREFVEAFEKVFDGDWEYTKGMFLIADYIAADGTFIHPKVDDEVEDWGYRSLLLDKYRRLKDLISV